MYIAANPSFLQKKKKPHKKNFQHSALTLVAYRMMNQKFYNGLNPPAICHLPQWKCQQLESTILS